jgi:hypothetical protein
MSTTKTTAEAGTTKEPRTMTVTLVGEGGKVLRVTASRRRDGWSTFAVERRKASDGKKTSERGATERHADLAAARVAMDRIVAEAAKRGWVRSERRGGFAPRPDAFSLATLPYAKATTTTMTATTAKPNRKK